LGAWGVVQYNDDWFILYDRRMRILTGDLYRAEQIREAERIAIDELGISGLQLMRNAGQAAFEALRRQWPEARSVAVYCGGGNNAGDGYVIARLALQLGWQVEVLAVTDPETLRGDALQSYRDFADAGGQTRLFDGEIAAVDVIVDALLGTGLNREVNQRYAVAIKAINAANKPVMAVDLPSGLHADTGCMMGCAVNADLTVTFIGLKAGLFTAQASDHCGEVVCDDLDVPEIVFSRIEPIARRLIPEALPCRERNAHKGQFGHVLLIGGNRGYNGAIRLAGEAALRGGAGLVSIATHREHSASLNIGRPELMCHGIENSAQLPPLLEKASVIVVGPGLGQDQWAHHLFAAALAANKPCVVDADALNILAQAPRRLDNALLTPHPGEAARLLQCRTQDIARDRYAAVARLRDHYAAVTVLKGAGSLIAGDDGIHVCSTGNPGMASGGMGDVLAGLCGALLGQGLSLTAAAKLAVFVHGKAGDLAAEQGERGLLASDLMPFIRHLLNS